MKNATRQSRMQALQLEVRDFDWHCRDCKQWLDSFLLLLFLHVPSPRRNDATQALCQVCWDLGQLIAAPSSDDVDDEGPSEQDYRAVNAFARRMLVEFGILDSVKDVFPQFQQEEGLFVQEAWEPFWTWAQEEFFPEPVADDAVVDAAMV